MSKFNFFQPLIADAFYITSPDDQVEVRNDSLQADNAGLVSVSNATNETLSFRAVYNTPQRLNGVYISAIQGEKGDAAFGVSITTEGAAKTYDYSVNLNGENYGYIPIDVPEKIDELTISLAFSSLSDNNISCSVPFICGLDAATLLSQCYENGRSYNPAGSVTFQQTKEQRFPEQTTHFPTKSIQFGDISEYQAANFNSFIKLNINKLLLLIERNPTSSHDFSMGFISQSESSRPDQDSNSIQLTIANKFSTIQDKPKVIWPEEV